MHMMNKSYYRFDARSDKSKGFKPDCSAGEYGRYLACTNLDTLLEKKGEACKLPPAIVLPPWRLMQGNNGGYTAKPMMCDADCMKEREHGWPACDPAAMKAGGDQATTPAMNGQDCKWKTMGKTCKLRACLGGLWGGKTAQAAWLPSQDHKDNTWPWWRYTPNATPAGIRQATEGNSIVDGALNHGNACAVHGGCSSYGPSGTMCRDAGCTCELRQVSTRAGPAMGYKPALQPTGFLSRLGAEGKDKDDAAHQVVMWFGTAGSEWKEANVVKLQAPPPCKILKGKMQS